MYISPALNFKVIKLLIWEPFNKYGYFFFKNKINFSHKLCIVWNWFITRKILISQKYFIFSKWCQIKLGAWTEVCYQIFCDWEMQIMWIMYGRMCGVYREVCLSKEEMFTAELNLGLPLQAWVEKTIHAVEIHWLSGKEKVPSAAISKCHTDSLQTWKDPYIIDFLEKKCKCKQCFLFCQFLGKIHLICWMTLIFQYFSSMHSFVCFLLFVCLMAYQLFWVI